MSPPLGIWSGGDDADASLSVSSEAVSGDWSSGEGCSFSCPNSDPTSLLWLGFILAMKLAPLTGGMMDIRDDRSNPIIA